MKFYTFSQIYYGSGRASMMLAIAECDTERLTRAQADYNLDFEGIVEGTDASSVEEAMWDELTEINPSSGLTVWKR